MRLCVVAVGKLKDPDLQRLCDQYVRRSQPLVPIAVTEVRDAGGLWEKIAREPGPKVVLDERGELPTTDDLAGWIAAWRDGGMRRIHFLIGDAHGFADEERRRADRTLALGRMTLPHRLARLVLLEQLYRVGTVIAGHPYHHG